MRMHPLILPALSLVGGIALAGAWPLPWLPALLGAGLAGLGLLWRGMRTGRFGPVWLVVFFFLLGVGLLSLKSAQVLPADHLLPLADNRPRILAADVISAPEPTDWGHRVLVQARSVDGRPVSGLVRLSLPSDVLTPQVGRRIRARVRLKPIVSFANPGGFDYAAFMADKGVRVRAHAGKRSGLKDIGQGEVSLPVVWLERSRAYLGALISSLPPGPARGLVRALVLGQRGELGTPVREAFAATGAAHLLAISGLHLGLVWGLAYLILRLALAAWPALALRWAVPKLAAFGALVPCAAYTALAGGSLPTLRALVMAACLVAALLFNRPYRPGGALALAALVIGIIWPKAPLTLSFQMSFIAVASILLAAGPLANRLRGRSMLARILGGLGGWLLVSAVVGLAVLPITLRGFHQVPVLSLPANAVLIPLTAMLCLPLALLGSAVGFIWQSAGVGILHLALWPARAAVDLPLYLSQIDGAVHFMAGPGVAAVVVIYAAALAFIVLRGRWRLLGGSGLAVAAIILILAQASPPKPDGRLTVWVLDVGQGLSVVARLPQGQVMVIDGGGWPGSDFDFGQKVVAPFLWHQGFNRVDLLVCSHRDYDHAGGLAFLARWFRPKALWTNGGGPDAGPFGRLLAAARQQKIPVVPASGLERDMEMGGVRVRVVWPPVGGFPKGRGENDRSIWLGLNLGRTWIWLPGDVGPRVENKVVPMLPSGGSQVLLAPHHGSKGSCTPRVLEKIRPKIVVYSAGCVNNFGMPRAESLSRSRAFGALVRSTAQNGCLKLVSDGNRWQASSFLSVPRRCP